MNFYIKPKWERYQYIDEDGKTVESRIEAKRFSSENEASRFRSLYLDRFDFEIKEE